MPSIHSSSARLLFTRAHAAPRGLGCSPAVALRVPRIVGTNSTGPCVAQGCSPRPRSCPAVCWGWGLLHRSCPEKGSCCQHWKRKEPHRDEQVGVGPPPSHHQLARVEWTPTLLYRQGGKTPCCSAAIWFTNLSCSPLSSNGRPASFRHRGKQNGNARSS